jgi:hypothetical protein
VFRELDEAAFAFRQALATDATLGEALSSALAIDSEFSASDALGALFAEGAMSAASITKAFLDKMGIQRPSRKFELPDKILGRCMQAYYGGRSEIRVRHEEVPIVVCDTTSEYPSVAVLLRLWPLLTAARVEVVDYTEEARSVLDSVNVETILKPSKWPAVA